MANDELMKPENRDFSFSEDHFTKIQHNYQLFPSNHDYSSAFEQLLDVNLQIGVSYDDNEFQIQEQKLMGLQDPGIHNNIAKETEVLDGNQNDSYFAFPDTDDARASELKATGLTQKLESEDINDDIELGMGHSVDFSRKPDMDPPPLPQCWSLRGAGPEHEMKVGMEFSDVKACRRALRDAAISLRFEMMTIKSDKTRYTAKCKGEGCPWRIHCAKLPGSPSFTIRTIHDSHTCGGISHLGHQQASAQWVADAVAEKLKENRYIKPKEILEEIHRVHGIALSYKQAWRGKERVLATLHDPFEDEYRFLPQYCDEIIRTNPGSIAVVYANPINKSFQQLFISFRASISGFLNACRPLIALDNTFLRSKYPATLLLATGFDGDGAVFPLAFALVDEENDCNWHRFLSELRKSLENYSENLPKLTVLSTREKAIVTGVEANFPTAFHGYCVHYLTERFRREFQSSLLANLLWDAAHSLTVLEFKSVMHKIEQISPKAFLWIQNISPALWASSYFEGSPRFGQLTATVKFTESLSKLIQDASDLPIIQTMECIHRYVTNLFKERREKSLHWSGVLVPSAEKQLLAATEESRSHRVYRANKVEFEVMTIQGNVVVDIQNRSCLCRRWQLYGLPCSHAVGALLASKEDVYEYTDNCLTVESYMRTYAETVQPVSDKDGWKETDSDDRIRTPKVLGAAQKRGRRSKRVRAEDLGRVKRLVRCSRCNQTGHFRTTCIASLM